MPLQHDKAISQCYPWKSCCGEITCELARDKLLRLFAPERRCQKHGVAEDCPGCKEVTVLIAPPATSVAYIARWMQGYLDMLSLIEIDDTA